MIHALTLDLRFRFYGCSKLYGIPVFDSITENRTSVKISQVITSRFKEKYGDKNVDDSQTVYACTAVHKCARGSKYFLYVCSTSYRIFFRIMK